VHLPLAKTLPGLQRYTVSRNILPADKSASYYLVAELDWTDMAALQRAFQSPEGQAIGQDIANNLARLKSGQSRCLPASRGSVRSGSWPIAESGTR